MGLGPVLPLMHFFLLRHEQMLAREEGHTHPETVKVNA
jgi:hypothetical protein